MDEEILAEFVAESKELMGELESVVERLEETGPSSSSPFPEELLREFAQKIDRIMGAAKTLEMMEPGHFVLLSIGKLAETCKALGYQAAERRRAELLPLFAAFWFETIEVIGALLENVANVDEARRIAGDFAPVLQKRLAWLKSKVDG